MIKFAIIVVVLAVLGVVDSQATANKCGVCMDVNKALCETESTYYVCLGSNKLGPYNCAADEVCSNDANVCVKKTAITAGIENVCGADSGACQACAAGKLFTCASKTQGARCVNGAMSTSIIFECAEGEICVSDAKDLDNVCVPQCAADFLKVNATCTNDVYTPPTMEPPTTPNPTAQQSVCAAAAVGKTTRFFFAYADWSCRSYVYCERSSSTSTVFTTTFAGSCSPPKPYFNTATGGCQAQVPENCSTDAPTTVTPEPATTPGETPTTTEEPTTEEETTVQP